MSFSEIILTITATLNALIAGLFFAWSVSVMPGFAGLTDREFVAAMRACNRAIQNPIFFLAFFGAPIFLMISVVLFYGQSTRFALLTAAAFFYLTGTFGFTVFGNVPLNNALERFDPASATDEEIARQRTAFERRWNNLNTVRAFASTLAFTLVAAAACLSRAN